MKPSERFCEANLNRSPNNQAEAKITWIEAFKRLQKQGLVSANITMIEKDKD